MLNSNIIYNFLRIRYNILKLYSICTICKKPPENPYLILLELFPNAKISKKMTMFLPEFRFCILRKRIRICFTVQFFQPVLMSLFDELRIFQKIRSCACHDFCRRQHALMGNTCLSLSNSLPGMKCCSCRIAAHIVCTVGTTQLHHRHR